jgi:5-methylcytosine-specific restriction endonuclease McrA
MNLKSLSTEELIAETVRRVQTEKAATIALIECLREIDSRRIYLEMGFSSLYEFAVQHLKLTEGAAHRRITAARLMNQIPEVKPALEEGRLNLTALSLAHGVFKKSDLTVSEKREVLRELENKPKSEVERTLVAIYPEAAVSERVRPLNENQSEVRLTLSKETLKKLDRLRELLAHTRANASLAELLEYGLDVALRKLDPELKGSGRAVSERTDSRKMETSKTKTASTQNTVKQTSHLSGEVAGNPRFVPASLKLAIWRRARGRCEYESAHEKRRCGSRFALQYDHIVPVARGGRSSADNLRVLCAGHNRAEADRILATPS